MNKIGPFLLFCLLLFGCDSSLDIPTSYRLYNNSLQADIADAVLSFWSALHKGEATKAMTGTPDIRSIESICVPVTKTSFCASSNAFVVHLSDGGCAIVITPSEYPSVIALVDSGSFDIDKLFNPEALYNIEGEEVMYHLIEDSILSEYEFELTGQQMPDTKSELLNVWYTDTIVHPIVHTKWNQTYPLNMCMPYVPDSLTLFGPNTAYNGRYAVGCTIIAAMQMVVATEHPATMTVGIHSYNTYTFQGVSDYNNYYWFNTNNYPYLPSYYLKNRTEELALILRDFGDNIGATHNPNGSTSASVLYAMNYLGYLDMQRYGALDVHYRLNGNLAYTPEVYTMIDNGKPLIIEGWHYSSTDTVGHAWLIDGYLKQHKTGPDNDYYERLFVHFNWGWGGKYDGYFSNTAINQRYQRDSIYDTNLADVLYSTYNFNTNCRYWTY